MKRPLFIGLSILFLGVLGWGIVNRANFAGSEKNTVTTTEVEEKTADSQSEQAKKLPLYRMTWRLCVDNPKSLKGADEKGCVNSVKTLYIWGSDKPEDFESKAVLFRDSPPTISPLVFFSLYIQHRGCYPNNNQPGKLGYYFADSTLMLDKKQYGKQKVVKDFEIDIKLEPVSEEIAQQLGNSNAPTLLAGGNTLCNLSNYVDKTS